MFNFFKKYISKEEQNTLYKKLDETTQNALIQIQNAIVRIREQNAQIESLNKKLTISVEALENIERAGKVAMTGSAHELIIGLCEQATLSLAKIRDVK